MQLLSFEEEDPLHGEALKKTDAFLARVNFYESEYHLLDQLKSSVQAQQRLVILVDAPTSKVMVPCALLDRVVTVVNAVKTQRITIMAFAGPRLDLLSALATKLKISLPLMSSYTVQLTSGSHQKFRSPPSFVQLLVTKASIVRAWHS